MTWFSTSLLSLALWRVQALHGTLSYSPTWPLSMLLQLIGSIFSYKVWFLNYWNYFLQCLFVLFWWGLSWPLLLLSSSPLSRIFFLLVYYIFSPQNVKSNAHRLSLLWPEECPSQCRHSVSIYWMKSCETGYPRILLYEKTEAVRSNHRGGNGVYKPTGSTLHGWCISHVCSGFQEYFSA